ncbi:MAG: HAE1 family hydrophobic/amphiphilic exporter-1 [Phenylobacterium sp.]|jgi:HAE1 family hydrophobic/amphiphilic exporter-1
MKIVDVAVSRPVTVWMFTFAVILFGLVSLSRLSINLLPELSYPTLTIRTDYLGAAPSEVEQLVSKPIEETIGTVKGVRKVHSISKAGQSDVLLEFEWGVKMDLASLEVREKLDILQLPLDVKSPLLLKFNPSLDPIMRLGLQSSETTELGGSRLKSQRTFAEEQIKRKLESLPGVASVKIGGGLEQEIQVLIDQQKASQLNLPVSQIVNRLKTENINQAGGKVEDGAQTFLVRTLNQFKNLDDIRNIFIAQREDKNIRLSDIAIVSDHHKERSSITRVNGNEAIEIAIYKEGDANTVQVAQQVKDELDAMKERLPSQYQLSLVYDQSIFIDNAITEVKSAGIIGGILAMFILYFFLKNIWATLIISISIPVSIIATFNLMYGNGISLNIMSLGGIALAVGLLVDNSIVVLENIARRKANGEAALTAATKGTKEVAMAITASTLTTMAVFFPLVFVEGIAGQLFSDQALTVTFALLASLIIAITLIPMLSSRTTATSEQPTDEFVKPSAPQVKPTSKISLLGWYLAMPFKLLFSVVIYNIFLGTTVALSFLIKGTSKLLGKAFAPLLWAFDKVYNAFAVVYAAMLKLALSQRLAFATLIIAICASSALLLPKLGMELIPSMSQGEFYVEVTLPAGTPLEQTDDVLKQLASVAKDNPLVKNSYALAGTGSLMNASPSQGGDHWGRLNVVLKPNSTLNDEKTVMTQLRQTIQQMPGIDAKFDKAELFSFKTPIEIELAGYDLNTLNLFSNKVVEKLQSNNRFVDVKSTLRNGHPELKVHFDHAKLAQLGLNASDVSELLSTQIGGEVATQYTLNDRKIDILVRTREEDRNSVADIKSIIVNPGSDHPIPLSSVATVTESIGPSEITRIGQQRVAIVSSNLAYGDLSLAIGEAKAALASMDIPLNIQARITGQNEEMESSFDSLKFALILAVFLVYIVMASQFESFLHPLLILFTVPLAGAGSIFGLYLSGTNVSIMVFIGLIMLSGIVVNNAIVLIDRINQLRDEGQEKTSAIMAAATSRLRPIVMTTLTTTLGLLPLAIGTGDGSEIRAPMAITVIYGLIFATVLTLIFIPVIYSLFDQKRFKATKAETKPQTDSNALNVAHAGE